MSVMPTNPTPAGIEYTYQSKDGKDYVIEFENEGEYLSYAPGKILATSKGFKQPNIEPGSIDGLGTYTSIDTDGDGLLNSIELNIYNTDPNNPDTDGDGYFDGDEVKNGYNPNGEGRL
jgi:hypothetical protein